MKTQMLMAGMFLTLWLSPSSSPQERLEGCVEQGPLVRALAEVRALDWNKVSIENIQAIWPANLHPIDCDGDECDSIGSKSRIINGYCECCDTFVFDKKEKKRDQLRRLGSVAIKFSSRKRAEIVASAKRFASAVGVPEGESQKLRIKEPFGFHWEGPENDISAVEIHFTEREGLWTLELAWSRYRGEPQRN